jgi:hypothetical protein
MSFKEYDDTITNDDKQHEVTWDKLRKGFYFRIQGNIEDEIRRAVYHLQQQHMIRTREKDANRVRDFTSEMTLKYQDDEIERYQKLHPEDKKKLEELVDKLVPQESLREKIKRRLREQGHI